MTTQTLAPDVLYRTRPQPGGGTAAIGIIGVILLLTGHWVWGLLLIGLAVWSWWLGEVVVTQRALKVRRGMFSSTTELQLAKLETIQMGWGFGTTRPMAVIGTGGTVYQLGTIVGCDDLRSHIEAAMEANRRP